MAEWPVPPQRRRDLRARPGESAGRTDPGAGQAEEPSARILQWPGPRAPADPSVDPRAHPRVDPGAHTGAHPAAGQEDAEPTRPRPAGAARRARGRAVLVPAAAVLAAWALTCFLDGVRPELLDRLVVGAAAASPLAVVVAIPLVALAVRARFWVIAGVTAVAALVPWMFVLGYALPSPVIPTDGVRLSVMLLDADGAGADAPSVVAAVARQRVDVLVVTETSSVLTHELTTSGLDPRLRPQWASVPEGGGRTGLCVYSRYPVADAEPLGGTRRPAVRITFDTGRGPVVVVAGRAFPPSGGTAAWRSDLGALEASARGPEPTVLAATLDATGQQAAFRRLTGSGLRDAAAILGRGLRPTWPSWSPLPLLPLDHVLVGPGIGVRSVRTLAVAGTSHRALVADVVVPAAARPSPVGD